MHWPSTGIAIVASLTLATSACGQATDSQLATPMSSAQFAALMRLHVKPTAEQWTVLHTLHADYFAAALALRDGEIEAYLRDRIDRSGGLLDEHLERELEPRRRRLSGQLAALDAKLFDDAAAILGDELHESMRGAALQRDRDRLEEEYRRTGLSPTGEGDLTPIVLALTWTEDELATLRPLVRNYQPAIVAIMRKLADRALDASGYFDSRTPEHAAAVEEVRRLKRELQQIHRALLADIKSQLAEYRGRQIRRRWIGERYGYLSVFPDPDNACRSALRSRGLTTEQRAALEADLATVVAADERLVNEGIALIDEGELAFDGRSRGFRPDPRVAEVRGKRTALEEASRASVVAIVGMDRMKAISSEAWKIDLDAPGPAIDPDAPAPPRVVEDERVASEQVLEGVLVPIPLGECRALVSNVAAPTTAAAIDAAHAAYLERWALEMSASMKTLLNESRSAGPASANLASISLEARQHAEAAERPLFDSLRELLAEASGPQGDRAMRLAQLDRLCAIWCSEPMREMQIVSRVQQPWNPIVVLRSIPMEDADRDALTAVVLDRGDALIAAVRQMREALADREGDRVTIGQRAWTARNTAMKPFESLRSAMIAAVAESKRPRLESFLLRATFPPIKDWSDAGEAFDPALRVEDLTADQRERIERMRVEFDAKYLDLCRQLVPDPLPKPTTERDLMWVYALSGAAQKRDERSRFERTELNAHAITRLRTVLSPEQQGRVPQLDRLDVFTASLDRR